MSYRALGLISQTHGISSSPTRSSATSFSPGNQSEVSFGVTGGGGEDTVSMVSAVGQRQDTVSVVQGSSGGNETVSVVQGSSGSGSTTNTGYNQSSQGNQSETKIVATRSQEPMNTLNIAGGMRNSYTSIAPLPKAIPSTGFRLAPAVATTSVNRAVASAIRPGIVLASPSLTEVLPAQAPPAMPAPEAPWYEDNTKLAIAGGSILALLIAAYFANKSRSSF